MKSFAILGKTVERGLVLCGMGGRGHLGRLMV